MSDGFELTVTALKISGEFLSRSTEPRLIDGAELPSEETILKAGRAILESTSSWKEGKTYAHGVKTLSRAKGPKDGANWHCRISEHTKDDATFDEFWSKLGENKPVNEKE